MNYLCSHSINWVFPAAYRCFSVCLNAVIESFKRHYHIQGRLLSAIVKLPHGHEHFVNIVAVRQNTVLWEEKN